MHVQMYASNSHSYTHLILALGIVRKPKVWVFITSEYHGIHDIGLPNYTARIPQECASSRQWTAPWRTALGPGDKHNNSREPS